MTLDYHILQRAISCGTGAAPTPFNGYVTKKAPHTFDRATFEHILPSYLKQHEAVPIEIQDGGKRRLFGVASHLDVHNWVADLHLLYLYHPELCTSCTCAAACNCPSYTQLWSLFLVETGREEAVKTGLREQVCSTQLSPNLSACSDTLHVADDDMDTSAICVHLEAGLQM